MDLEATFTAFCGKRRIASGPVADVLRQTKAWVERPHSESILIFEDETGNQIDFDFRGSADEVIARLSAHPHFAGSLAPEKRAGPGRPKLGVVSREVSLLPRHWDWLERQPGGISVALRKLVEVAAKSGRGQELARRAREAAGKFMWAMAGDLPGFEEASRALFAKDQVRLEALCGAWPADIREHVTWLAARAAQLEQAAAGEQQAAGAAG